MRTFGLATATLITVLLSTASFAHARGLSAQRPAGFSAESLLRLHETRQRLNQMQAETSAPSALASKKDWKDANWNRVPVIQPQDLQARFQLIRDEKILKDSQNRSRRLTWLYPDDGCYARAELAARLLQSKGAAAPAKIFAFGGLAVNTPNHPDGMVSWWYHVAPIVRVGTEYYVYDPAIEPQRPLKAQEWLKIMNAPEAQISICSTNSYDPDSPCETTRSYEQSARGDETNFLSMEWTRLQYLGRSPEAELGERPPWKK